MEGKVFSGLGRGAYFVRLYSESIEREMGFRPFPGTLNLRLRRGVEFEGKELRPEGLNPIMWRAVRIVSASNDLIGSAARLQARIFGALIRPVKTSHEKDVVEIIARQELRKELRLKDGDKVKFDFC